MSVKSIISCCKYQLYRMRFIPVFFAVWVFGTMILGAALEAAVTKTPFSLRGIAMGGLDVLMGFLLFVFMCVSMADFINTAAANGASRITACVSAFISSVIFSFVSALEVSVVFPIVSLITGNMESWGAEVYGAGDALEQAGLGTAQIRLRFFFICLFINVALCAGAMLLTAIYYRLPQWLAVIVILAIILFPTVGVIMLFGIDFFARMIGQAMIFAGFAFADGSPLGNVFRGAAVFTGASAILLALSCLILCRSAVKPVSVKGE